MNQFYCQAPSLVATQCKAFVFEFPSSNLKQNTGLVPFALVALFLGRRRANYFLFILSICFSYTMSDPDRKYIQKKTPKNESVVAIVFPFL